MKRVLITGATGFLGRPVVEALASSNTEIVAIGRSDRPVGFHTSAEWRSCDLLADPIAVDRIVATAQADTLIHMAWETTHGRFWHERSNLDWLAASSRLARAFLEAGGKRIVGIGTCAEYQPPENGPCREETTPLAQSPLYAVAKDALRRAAGCAAKDTGTTFAWGRIFFVYGEHENRARLVPSIALSLLQGREAECSSGRQVRDFMHIRDCGKAVAALAGSDISGAVNICSGEPVTIAEIVTRLAGHTGRRDLVRLGALPDRAGEPLNWWGDARRLRQEVGFNPQVPLDEGLRDALEWWSNHPYLRQKPVV